MSPRAFDRMTTSVARTVPELQNAQTRGVERAALLVTTAIRTEIRKTTGDMRLSGARNSKVGARYDIKGTKNPTALIRPFGRIWLIERPIGPHLILPRMVAVRRGGVVINRGRRSEATGRRLRGGKRALTIGGGFYASANHGGVSRQSGPWKRGVDKSAKDAEKVFKTEIDKGLRKAWL